MTHYLWPCSSFLFPKNYHLISRDCGCNGRIGISLITYSRPIHQCIISQIGNSKLRNCIAAGEKMVECRISRPPAACVSPNHCADTRFVENRLRSPSNRRSRTNRDDELNASDSRRKEFRRELL